MYSIFIGTITPTRPGAGANPPIAGHLPHRVRAAASAFTRPVIWWSAEKRFPLTRVLPSAAVAAALSHVLARSLLETRADFPSSPQRKKAQPTMYANQC